MRRDLERELESCREELAEALRQQAATSEILRLISTSPADLDEVLPVVAEHAARLCEGDVAQILRVEGDLLRVMAAYGPVPSRLRGEAVQITRRSVAGRAVSDAKTVHVHDLFAELETEFPDAKPHAHLWKHRTVVATPLLRKGVAIGAVVVRRLKVRPFTDRQIALLETFANQAVIAIENVRLLNETKEALERQTATSEILRVISSSPTDIQPIFDSIVQSAVRLCDGLFAAAFRFDGERLYFIAQHNFTPEGLETAKRAFPMRPQRDIAVGRAVLDCAVVHFPDVEHAPQQIFQQALGYRSVLAVPMLCDGQPIGAIAVTRAEARPFSDTQIELLKTFADQAVIAIENVRLFNETKEALERQTAISEILRVISASPADVQPVLDTVTARAAKICGADDSLIVLVEGNRLRRVAGLERIPAMPVGDTVPLDRGSVMGRAIIDRTNLQVPDLMNAPAEEYPLGRELARAHGHRTTLAVPLLRERQVLGAIVLRRSEVRAFTEKQIELLATFADQAAIAIENVRLFNEIKEALERQTATSEILDVISRSPTDIQPVFDTVAANAVKLCDAGFSIVTRFDGELIHVAAICNVRPESADAIRNAFPAPPSGRGADSRAILNRAIVHIPDVRNDPDYSPSGLAETAGVRSIVAVPMLRGGSSLGAIGVSRSEPRPFTEQQIALLKTFADQAVIAIENVRLFNETKEALEQQTATANILKVISSSPTDVQPVFDAVAETAARVCGASDALIRRVDGDKASVVAHFGSIPVTAEAHSIPITRSTVHGRAILERRTIHVEDIVAEFERGEYPDTFPFHRGSAYRTLLNAPLLREGAAIGAIVIRRVEKRPFSEKQVKLLETFAAQAVIAIENVRLFNETKEALKRQTATAEILKVIAASPSDVQPVFDAIVRSGLRLFNGKGIGILLVDGDQLQLGSAGGIIDLESARRKYPLPLNRDSVSGQAILDKSVVNIADCQAPEIAETARSLGQALDYRAIASAPMLREGIAIGAITVVRREAGALNEKETALLKTFADQAVIAIENVRLFKELQARTEALTRSVGQLTALSEVGQAISSTLELETVLQAIVSRAVQLAGLDGGSIYEFDELAQVFTLQAAENMPEELIEAVRKAPIRLGDGAVGRTGITREPTQVPDTHDESYQSGRKELLIRAGYRAVIAVPLLREDHLLGALLVNRKTPGAFAPETVELLKTFAAQSALAIQNARLFREIAEKGRQLEVASRHKSDFLASMSHELRTPLNAILGFNEMLLGQVYGDVPADMQAPLADIQTSGRHLLRLINNVLDLAKIEAGRMELSLADYSVNDTVENVRSTLRPLAAEKGLEFIATVPADIPLAYGDGGRITQCLMNLAGNSLKFTKAGKVEISVEQKDGLLIYRVADTGIGIPPDKIGSLFTEFKQTDATIASEYGGTGLGLSISRKFIEMHGGRIWVESEVGRGSTFIFEIPLRAGERKAA